MECKPILQRGQCLILISAVFVLFSFIHCNTSTSPIRNNAKVFIHKEGSSYTIYRNGKPFVVKGAAGYTQLATLRAIGGNTIRTWDTINLGAILDEAQRNNLAVIAGLPLPGSNYLNYFYKDADKVAANYRGLQQIITRYKDHPALLMWCLGNEPGFNNKPGSRYFYRAFNALLDMIHATDPGHPVTTTMVNFSIWEALWIKWKVHGLDLVSFNIFGQLQQLQAKLHKYSWIWNGPFLISEWGAYGPWEAPVTAWGAPIENTSTKKAEHYQQLYAQLPANDPRFLGALVFYWGQKQETTPTWFSLFDEHGAVTAAVNTLQYLWTGKQAAAPAPVINYMLLGGKGAADNIMLPPNALQTARVLDSAAAGPHTLHWELWQEDWFSELNRKPLKLLDTLITTNSRQLQFRTPVKEGPYRIYVKLSDSSGNFATANTPFYVVEKE
ncbi:hypothetical protein F0L74_05220 [Chitinophaga agrisoli]|uniref:Glycoside hydrolase family 2 catalytic domain-containing protein n=1 Tax=Chitinophaga agrisoli TaxID=2607653 RepID=A0A5B2W1Z0_9BACT|nr:glycoside hydrolase family 2 TIM barrel-domain containing protein [Chitinophaga agrisoli]KAA2245365.1 hypothetical protein F0L74_05220 [Chitinophaga agrisoli]